MNADLPGQTLPLDAGATLVVGAPIRHVDPLSWFLGRTSSGASAVIAVTMEPPAPRLDADAVERRLGALRGLALPGIAAPLGFGLLADGRLWLAWPQVSGYPLIEEVPEGADAPTLLLQALQALRRVHALGLGHGRLTLASIVVQRVPPAGWITQIVDLGVSRLIGEPPPDGGQAADRLAAIGLVRLALRGPAQRDRALAEGLRDLEKAHDLHGLAERVRRLVVPPSPVRRASRVAVVLLPGLLAAAAGAAGVLWWFGRGAPTEAPPDAIALGGTTFPDAAPVRAVLPPTRPEDAARPVARPVDAAVAGPDAAPATVAGPDAAPPIIDAAVPSAPDAAVPSAPDAAVPSAPDAAVPSAPDAAVPIVDAAVPSAPDAAVPSAPDAAAPSAPDAAVARSPDAGSPLTVEEARRRQADLEAQTAADQAAAEAARAEAARAQAEIERLKAALEAAQPAAPASR